MRFDLLSSLCDHAFFADLGANLHNSLCYEQFLSEGFGWHRNTTFSRISPWPDTTTLCKRFLIIFYFFYFLRTYATPDTNQVYQVWRTFIKSGLWTRKLTKLNETSGFSIGLNPVYYSCCPNLHKTKSSKNLRFWAILDKAFLSKTSFSAGLEQEEDKPFDLKPVTRLLQLVNCLCSLEPPAYWPPRCHGFALDSLVCMISATAVQQAHMVKPNRVWNVWKSLHTDGGVCVSVWVCVRVCKGYHHPACLRLHLK
jgi:hypothetical protein